MRNISIQYLPRRKKVSMAEMLKSELKNKTSSKAFKKLNFAVELVRYLLTKEEFFISQDEILKEMTKIGFSRSYAYTRIKLYSQGIIVKNSKTKPDILEPLLIEKSRYELDGGVGVAYKLNDDWKKVPIDQIGLTLHGK